MGWERHSELKDSGDDGLTHHVIPRISIRNPRGIRFEGRHSERKDSLRLAPLGSTIQGMTLNKGLLRFTIQGMTV